jgi:dihydroflavonol-4-reductase
MTTPPLVLITGCAGFLGSVVTAYTLAAGYRVRGTVRNPSDEAKVAPIRTLAASLGASSRLELVAAQLSSPQGWAEAVAGCTFVLHVASPVPTVAVKDEEAEVIQPAIDGVLNVLRAASACPSVRRVVLTSSVSAVNEGRTGEWSTHVFDEADWSAVADASKTSAYAISKTKAEKAAWAFMETEVSAERRATFSLVALNPGFIYGPQASGSASSSATVFTRLLTRELPAVPALVLASVDVRDVAIAHLRAMVADNVAGERIILVGDQTLSLLDMAHLLARNFDPLGYRVPESRLPSFAMRIAALFDGALKVVLPSLDKVPRFDNSKAKRLLGFGGARPPFKDIEVAAVAACNSLIAHGCIPDRSKGKILSTPSPAGGPKAAAGTPQDKVDALLEYRVGSGGPIDPKDLEGIAWVGAAE